MSNPWKSRFVPAHRKPKDPLRRAQLAPSHPMPPVLCLTCDHLRLIHRDNKDCLRAGCSCPAFVDSPPSVGDTKEHQ